MAGKRGANKQKRAPRVPRPLTLGVSLQRRTLSAGALARGAVDQAFQLGIVPSSLPDWASLTAVWKRFRLMSVEFVFVLNGEFDGTPQYPTLVVASDVTSTGAPASLAEAMSLKGKRLLSFNATRAVQRFGLTPLVWTSGSLTLTMPCARAFAPLSGGPSFTSLVGWGINYNTAGGAPPVTVLVDMLLEFSYPQ